MPVTGRQIFVVVILCITNEKCEFCFAALIATFGDINAAIERLLANGQVSMS